MTSLRQRQEIGAIHVSGKGNKVIIQQSTLGWTLVLLVIAACLLLAYQRSQMATRHPGSAKAISGPESALTVPPAAVQLPDPTLSPGQPTDLEPSGMLTPPVKARILVLNIAKLEPGDDRGLADCRAQTVATLEQRAVQKQAQASLMVMAKANDGLHMLDEAELPDPGPEPVYEPPESEPPPLTPEQEAAFDRALAGGDQLLESFFVRDKKQARRDYLHKLKEYNATVSKEAEEARQNYEERRSAWLGRKRVCDAWKAGQLAKGKTRTRLRMEWERAREKLVVGLRRWTQTSDASRGG